MEVHVFTPTGLRQKIDVRYKCRCKVVHVLQCMYLNLTRIHKYAFPCYLGLPPYFFFDFYIQLHSSQHIPYKRSRAHSCFITFGYFIHPNTLHYTKDLQKQKTKMILKPMRWIRIYNGELQDHVSCHNLCLDHFYMNVIKVQ